MKYKTGQKVVIYNDRVRFRDIEGLEGYIGIGTFLGYFEDENGSSISRAQLDGTDITIDVDRYSNISFYDPAYFEKRIQIAKEEIEAKQRFIYVSMYDLENAIRDNKGRK